MRTAAPIQIVTPNLFGPIPGRYDDPASRAWNLAIALFYKAGGAPWRVATPALDTLYVGISFHHRWHRGGHGVHAGLAAGIVAATGFMRGSLTPSNRDLKDSPSGAVRPRRPR